MQYDIHQVLTNPDFSQPWDSPAWDKAAVVQIDQFRPESGEHHPTTHAKVLYDDKGLYVYFQVQDQFVHSTVTDLQGSVCKDSCVEFFVEPIAGKNYFNFEINCGGTMLLYYIEDIQITPKRYKEVSAEDCQMVEIHAMMPKVVDPEIVEPTTWTMGFFIPFALFEKYLGQTVEPGQWRGNFYKCGSLKPHWASWAPMAGKQLQFHQPQLFGSLRFVPAP